LCSIIEAAYARHDATIALDRERRRIARDLTAWRRSERSPLDVLRSASRPRRCIHGLPLDVAIVCDGCRAMTA
jgi:hypothetical protein